MGEERKCISCVRKCIVNNLLIIYFVWFFGLLEVGWGYSFFFFLLWGSIYYKKNGLFILVLDILKCFLGVVLIFLIVIINEIGCCMMFD